jgi:hypothetical protein
VTGAELYVLALSAAFWVALLGFRVAPRDAGRGVAGLVIGAALARAGGLLCVPAGLLLAAPLRAPRRDPFLDATLPALPLACAVAKLGCVAAGCCAAAGGEALGFATFGAALRLAPRTHAAALALAGTGLVRLAALPFRPEARGSAWLAVVWLAAAALRCPPSRGGETCPRPGSATSSRTHPSSRPGCAASSEARAISR